VHNNLVLLLHRILRFPDKSAISSQATNGHSQSTVGSLGGPVEELPYFSDLQLLDKSGSWILQSSVRVLDGSKPESMALGINELKAFKDQMKGVVDLEVGDRLALDTRVR
jgi:mediator of RNA polymerase II transcription subunit 18, fungi type